MILNLIKTPWCFYLESQRTLKPLCIINLLFQIISKLIRKRLTYYLCSGFLEVIISRKILYVIWHRSSKNCAANYMGSVAISHSKETELARFLQRNNWMFIWLCTERKRENRGLLQCAGSRDYGDWWDSLNLQLLARHSGELTVDRYLMPASHVQENRHVDQS